MSFFKDATLLCAAVMSVVFAHPVSAQSAPRVLGISHVAVKATDVEKSVAFYCDFLGYAEQGRLNYLTNGSLMLVYLKVSETQWIEIFDAAKVPASADRLYQIALQVEDAPAVRDHLAANGYRLKVPPEVKLGQMKNANFTVKDPHGYIIEFVQYMPEGRTIMDRGRFLSETRISDHIMHAGAVVSDLSASKHFYEDLFGFQESWRGSMNDRELSWIHLRIAENPEFVEFMLDPKVDPHFCLEVPDIEKAKEKLEKNPYLSTYQQQRKALEIKTGKNHKRQLNLWDPEGVRVELMEPNTIDGQPVPSSQAPLPLFQPKP